MIELFNFSFFSITGWGIGLDYRDIEWFALERNRDHSVIFEIASKYCISDSFVDYDGYSISSKRFLPTVVDIMVSELNSPIPVHFSLLIPRISTFTLAISCLTTSNLPWFIDLTFQVPMQYCSLQHQTLLLSPVTSTELTRAKTAWQSVYCTHLSKGQEVYRPFTQDSSKKNEDQNDEGISAAVPMVRPGSQGQCRKLSRVPRRREALVQKGWSHINREACPTWGTHSLLPASWGTTPGKPHYSGLTF